MAKIARAAPSKSPGWTAPKSSTLSQAIVRQVLERCFEGQLKPGDWVGTEASLAEQFGVSRMAVRDALRALNALGVVEIRKGAGGGIRIAHGDSDHFSDALAVQLSLLGIAPRQAFDAQFAIEAMTAELAAAQANAGDLAKLDAILKEAEGQLNEPSVWPETIMRFHIALADASHSPALALLLRGIMRILERHYARRTTPARASQATANYRRLLTALKRGDADAAGAAMREQLGQVRRGMQRRAAES